MHIGCLGTETGKDSTDPDKWIGFSAGDTRQAEQGQGVKGELAPGGAVWQDWFLVTLGYCSWGVEKPPVESEEKRHEVRNKVPSSYAVLTPYPMGRVHTPSKGSRGHLQSLSLVLESHSL